MTVITTRDQVPQIARPMPMAPRAAGASAAGGLTGKDFLRILQKRKWMILITLLSVIALTVLGTLAWQLYAPLFTAEALIEVNPPKATPWGDPTMYPQEIMDRQAMQLARLIEREVVMEDAAKNKDLIRTEWFAKDPATAPRRLTQEIAVTPLAKTNLIRISMTGLAPRELAEIVNAVADAGVREVTNSKQTDRRDDSKKLGDELTNLGQKLDQNRRERGTLTSDATVTNLTSRRDSLAIQMSTLVPELTKLTVAQAAADEALRLITKQKETPGLLENSPEVMGAMEMDQTLRSLELAESSWTTELDDARRRFGEKHLAVMKLKGRLDSVRRQISDRHTEQVKIQVDGMVRMREDQLNAITAQLVKIRSEYQSADSVARDLATRLAKVEQLDVLIKDLEEQIRRLQARNIELLLLTSSDPPIRLRSSARIPTERSHPRWALMMPLGVMLGLIVGLGLSFALELTDTSVKSPSDVSRRLDLPLLGMVPHLEDMDEEIEDLRLAYSTAPNSLVSEAFRQIRTCLLFSGPASTRRSLLVASPLPEDGRTSVAMNLAAAMAQGGRKVLVVDANFRQPMIHKLFPNCPASGLSSALVGQGKWSEMVHNVMPNLSVMATGPLPPNPSELLGSEPMRQIIAEMTAEYDQVIFDSAPALVVSDSAILSTLVDGVVLTVRAGVNTYGIVLRTRDMLNRVGAHVLGVVLNGIRITAGGYLRKNYDAFYEYHSQAQLPQETKSEEVKPTHADA